MILVYPMLVSKSVSENSIPGIAKTIENYIMINAQDMIVNNKAIKKQTKGIIGTMLRIVGGKLIGESVNLSEGSIPKGSGPGTKGKDKGDDEDYDFDDDDTESDKNYKRERMRTKDARDDEKHEYDQLTKNAKRAKVDAKIQDMKSVTLEPTYMTIEKTDKYGNKSSEFVGIKVVPIRVKSDVQLSHLILQDTKVGALFAMSLSLGRTFMRKAWSFLDKWTHKLRIGGLTPSGDPRRDILMGRTGMGDNGQSFIVLSKQEDVDEYFIKNIQKINRLYKMGWGNIIIADDIGRTAYFCMQNLRGMCNSVPYAMMYQTLGQSKAYESMEDARKQNSSVFKLSKRFSKIVGESKVDLLMDKYSQLSEGNYNE